ncbi:MAG TPA: ABC transporter ATP-binding protein [Haliangiales bacterium]|nr:ABC transporter ATP-binding protein [Haliangiales bacterium]
MTIHVRNLVKQFGRQRALAGVSLDLEPGRTTALLGHNGAGKSTLIGLLSTLVRPTAGEIVWEPAPRSPRAEIGLLAHEAMVYAELTAEENLRFWGTLYDVDGLPARAAALLDDVGLDGQARGRPARTFSRGMLQRLALARALLPRPRVLLLDEPFTGLDREGTAALARVLAREKQAGRTILVATHDLEAVAGACDHLVVLRAGRVALDERQDALFSLAELRRKYDQSAEPRT